MPPKYPPPPPAMRDAGPIVCGCYRVGLNTLIRTIRQGQLRTPEQIGERLHAGQKCGSCIPRLQELIADIVDE